MRGVLLTMGIGSIPGQRRLGDAAHGFTTLPVVMLGIVSVVAGVLGSLIAAAGGAAEEIAIVVGTLLPRIPPGATIHTFCAVGVYNASMRRIQIHIDEALDEAAEKEATRRGQSKAALIRSALASELAFEEAPSKDPWDAITGWLDDGAVKDLDAVIYERKR
jgi:hypothetical protein